MGRTATIRNGSERTSWKPEKRKFARGRQTKSSESCILYDIIHARLAPERLGHLSEGCATLRFGGSVAEVGDVEVARCLPHRPLASPIVARGCGEVLKDT